MRQAVRHPDWETRLDGFLSEHRNRQFQYGENDCCLFVADAVLAMTGVDLAASCRGRYHSRREALSIARDRTGRASIRTLVEQLLAGLTPVPVLCAQRGDILLVRRSRDVSLGILALNGRDILNASAEGFLRLPLSLAIRAWRI